jgi:hypothetical protein
MIETYHAGLGSTLLRLKEDCLRLAARGTGFLDAGQLYVEKE